MRKTNTTIQTSNKQAVHAIFPLNFKKPLIENFRLNEHYELAAFDTDVSNYATFVLNTNSEDYARTVFISVYEYPQIPFKDVVAELTETVLKIREKRQEIRFIIVFPVVVSEHDIFKEDIKTLLMNGVYDLHFFGEYSFNDIINMLDSPQPIQALNHLFTEEELNEIVATGKGKEQLSHQKNKEKQDAKSHERSNVAETPSPINTPTVEETPIQKELEKVNVEPVVTVKFDKSKKDVIQNNREIPSNSNKATSHTKKIAFIGLTRSVGTSFITTNYASYLSKFYDVAVYENPVYEEHRTYLADMFMFFEDDPHRQTLPLAIKQNVPFENAKKYALNKVTYYPVNYLDVPIFDFSTNETMLYTNSGSHEIKLYDMGCVNYEELFTNKLHEKFDLFDEIVLVVDTMPNKLIPHTKTLATLRNELELRGVNVTILVNQYEKTVSLTDLKAFEFNQLVTVPTIERKVLLNAAYKRLTVFTTSKDVAENLIIPFKKMSSFMELDVFENESSKVPKKKASFLKLAFAK